jgi:hypothetical protein
VSVPLNSLPTFSNTRRVAHFFVLAGAPNVTTLHCARRHLVLARCLLPIHFPSVLDTARKSIRLCRIQCESTYTAQTGSAALATLNSDQAANLAHLDRPTPPDSSPDDLTRARNNTMPSPQKRAQRVRRDLRSDAIAESSSPSRPSKRRRKVWIDPCPVASVAHPPQPLSLSLLLPSLPLKSMHPRFMPLTMLPRAE